MPLSVLHSWESHLHTIHSVAKWYNLIPLLIDSCALKVTFGLMSHWPCVADFFVYPPIALKAYGWEVRTVLIACYGTIASFHFHFVLHSVCLPLYYLLVPMIAVV